MGCAGPPGSSAQHQRGVGSRASAPQAEALLLTQRPQQADQPSTWLCWGDLERPTPPEDCQLHGRRAKAEQARPAEKRPTGWGAAGECTERVCDGQWMASRPGRRPTGPPLRGQGCAGTEASKPQPLRAGTSSLPHGTFSFHQ